MCRWAGMISQSIIELLKSESRPNPGSSYVGAKELGNLGVRRQHSVAHFHIRAEDLMQ